MKIGIGITTTNNRKNSFDIERYKKYLSLSYDYSYFINIDENFEGVSISRNKCLKYLYDQGCDYIFLFDDDCYPIMYNYDKYFVDTAIKYNAHYSLLPNIFNSNYKQFNDDLDEWGNYLGCFGFYSRKVIEEIGYFNIDYYKYGFEDAEYHHRIRRSSLSNGEILCFNKTPFFIFSEDQYHQNPSINYNMDEKNIFIEKNSLIFQSNIKKIDNNQIYLGYNEGFS